MGRSLFCTIVAMGLALATSATSTSMAADAAVAVCTISAWVNDPDPNGLNVRAGPSRDAAVIGRLPLDDDHFPAKVSIIGAQDGWFRIDKAVLDDYTDTQPKVVFEGEGWVSGRLLSLLVNDPDLHAAPWAESPVVAHLFYQDAYGSVAGADSFGVTRLITCQGDWVQVEGTFIDTQLTGWATRTCSNQVTTCP
ncbi:SH3 domain-containing protein [Paradevosia shaoguanensis]|uniref:SH3 domain-containing protein n=1 Tax=Paradevosia shaoguanensis TaxID=1335043 RepID=UPI001932A962|nr:SH3 domain-containing protein [Paradevosia shaoguanensis]